MSTTISISGLVKTFGPTRALDGLDLEVRPGEVHGFLGPNGAGKTTTIRVLLGLLRADAGQAELLGGDPWRDAVALHRRLAYVPGDVTLWPNLSGGEVIDLLGRLRGGLDPDAPGRAARAVRAGPAQEGPHLLQGQPPEGRAGRRAGLRRRAAAAGRADLGPRPADGGRLPGGHRRRAAPRAHGAAVQPHPGRGRGPVRPGEHHPGRPHRRVGHAGRAAPPHPHLDRRRAGRPAGRAGRAGPACTTWQVDGTRVRCQVDADRLDEVLRHLSAAGVRSLTSQPPTLEELFLRHYQADEAAASGPQTRGGAAVSTGGRAGSPAPASCCGWPCAATGSWAESGSLACSRSPPARPPASSRCTRPRPTWTGWPGRPRASGRTRPWSPSRARPMTPAPTVGPPPGRWSPLGSSCSA